MQPIQPLLSADRVSALARGESIRVRVQGGSMLPWLRPGASVCIQPVRRELLPGDIALFWRDAAHPVLHRVVSVHQVDEAFMVECLGDSEHGSPEPVSASAVIGVAKTTPFRRWVYRIVNPPRRLINRLCHQMGICLPHG
jgi:hypothetical protein